MIDFWLKYPAETWRDGTLFFASGWPLWLALALIGVGGALLVAGLVRRGHNLSPAQRLGIGVLQLMLLAGVVTLLWRPSLSVDRVLPGSNTLAVLVDDSASMSYQHAGRSRLDAVRELLGGDAFAELAEDFDVELFRFSDRATPIDDLTELAGRDDASALSRSLDQVLQRSAQNPLGAVLVLSDGIDTAPRDRTLGQLSRWEIPVHTVGLGRERIPEDLGIGAVKLPRRLAPGSRLRAQLTIVHAGPAEARIKVSRDQELLAVREVALGEGDRTTVWMDLPLGELGHHALTFSLEPGPNDSNLANNTLTRMLEVAEQTRRVLYIEGEPRWEYKFLRRAVSADPGLELVSLLRVSPNKYYRQGIASAEELEGGFPADAETLFAYDGIVIGSIEAASFDEQQLGLIRDFVAQRGGGLLLLGGRSGLGQGGWGNSSLAGVLPAALPAAERESFSRQRWPVVRTPAGRSSALLRWDDDPATDDELWDSLPALADYQLLGALKPAASTLLDVVVDGAPQPLLVEQPYGRGRALILATGGTWRWQMSLPLEDQRHETFWRQTLRALTSEAREQFELDVSSEGGELSLRAELRDNAFEPRSGAPLVAQISGSTVSRVSLTPLPGEPGVYRGSVPMSGDGPHFIEAIAEPATGGVTAAMEPPKAVPARAAFFHASQRQERVTLAQNRTGLEAISVATGGRYFTTDGADRLSDVISTTSAGITATEVLPVWDAPLLLLLLVLVKAAEWLLRRRWSVI
ncbi:MAG: hypothetical protein AAF358_20570 [Pseudomonadota bacterium]